MPKRSERSVRRVKETLATPAARRRTEERALSMTPPPILAPGGPFGAPGVMSNATPEDATGQIGTPGTLNMWGFISGEDYNRDLDGYPMFGKYDQMRRGDAQVSASLMQIKLPFKAARKVIRPATDDPQDIAIADFVQECLLADRAMLRPFEQVLDHMMLRFDFGCSAEEIIWTIGENGELRVKDLAPRLPRTFYRWMEWPSGDQIGQLQYLQQFAPKNGQYGFWNIPAERLMLHAHKREGNNYYGMSILRPAYPSWFWKQQLYRIDAIRHDRMGAGIFKASLTEHYDPKTATLTKIEETLRGLRSHDQAYVVEPYGVVYGFLEPKTSESMTSGLLLSIEHHNQMIAANVLQQFSTQGQQKHGSLGQAKVTHDVFMDALVGQGVEMGAEIENGVIRALCDANFDMTGRGYPRFVFADIASADVNSIAENMAKLATAKLITAEDDLEDWLRELHDAPALPEELRGRDRTPPPPAPFGQPGAGPADKGAAHLVPDADGTAPKPVEASVRDYFTENGRKFSRVPTAFERRVFDLHAVPAKLDDMQTGLLRKMSAIRRTQLTALAARIAQKDGRDTAAFTDIRHKHIAIPGIADLVKAIRASQTAALAYGRQTVKDELKKQGVTVPKTIAAGPAAAGRQSTTSSLVSSAQITARKQAEAWRSRIMDTGLRLRRNGLQGKDLEDRIQKELDDEIESGAKRDAAAEINEAFGLGRAGMAGELGDQIESATYSAILDSNVCEPCADLDGEVFETDSPEYDQNMPPNVSCLGGDQCRCVYILQAKDDTE